MLRPATPLTLAFLAAFILLLLSTLSTPVIVDIPLGANGGFNFGVFGYCKIGKGGYCSSPKIGYDRDELDAANQQDYNLTANNRFTLSYILVVHPVAAFMVLICTILAGAAHFQGPSHSPRFLLGLLIFTFPTLLVTLLAFLVDILLFIPHMQWGGWIVLPATIIVTACGVLTCAMRRTLVGRKARKKRIAENADMNGSEYYAMKQEAVMRTPMAAQTAPPEPDYARAESPPPLNNAQGANGAATYEKQPRYANFEFGDGRPSMDDRTPLNAREPSVRTMDSGPRSQGNINGQHMSGSTLPGGAAAYSDQLEPVSPLEGGFRGTNGSYRGRGGPFPPYGRGGPPPPFGGRGRGYGPRGGPGGPQMRGGYLPRGNYPPRGAMRGRPPPGWYPRGGPRGGPMMRGRPPPPGYVGGYGGSPSGSRANNDLYGPSNMDYDAPGQEGYGSHEPYDFDQVVAPQDEPDGYDRQPSPGYDGSQSPNNFNDRRTSQSQTRDPSSFGFSGRQPSPARSQSTPRDNSPPPPLPYNPEVAPGQAIELDHRHGSPAQSPTAQSHPVSMDELGQLPRHANYSEENYAPAPGWQHEPAELSGRSPQVEHQKLVHPPSAELPGHEVATGGMGQQLHHRAASHGSYYEDVDPRFSEDPPIQSAPHISTTSAQHMPSSLVPGYGTQNQEMLSAQDRNDTHSPAHSDNSNFTSISQRGINPEWQPPAGARQMPPRAPRNDVLASNPDFIVPGASGARTAHLRGMSGGGNHRYPDPQ